MESVSFVGIDIKVIAWNEGALTAVAEDWLAVPPPVDAHNVERYVIGRFGEPCDIALGSTDGYGEILKGWMFPSSALRDLGLPSDGLEMMVVPFVRFPDGTRRELFEYNAALNHEFAALVGSTLGSVNPAELAPVEQRSRLDEERLTLAGPTCDLVELQLGGWLRRMLVEGWTYLIVQVGHDGRYVQFLTHSGSWLRCEAVGNRYLGASPLSSFERSALASLGWVEPSTDPEGCGNHSMELGEFMEQSDPDRPGPDLSRGGSDHRGSDHHSSDHPSSDRSDRPDEVEVMRVASIAAKTLCEVFGPLSLDETEILVGHASTMRS